MMQVSKYKAPLIAATAVLLLQGVWVTPGFAASDFFRQAQSHYQSPAADLGGDGTMNMPYDRDYRYSSSRSDRSASSGNSSTSADRARASDYADQGREALAAGDNVKACAAFTNAIKYYKRAGLDEPSINQLAARSCQA
jgi:hypothetical protein